jgi:hypothetical protein
VGVENKSKGVLFRNFEEYRDFYAALSKDKPSKGNRYYQVGESIAKMACDSAAHRASQDRTE